MLGILLVGLYDSKYDNIVIATTTVSDSNTSNSIENVSSLTENEKITTDTSDNINQNQSITISNELEIKNSTQPGLGFNPSNSNLYVAYHKGNFTSADLYLIKSKDGGKTYSDPVRVNQKEGDAYLSDYPVAIRFDSDNNVYVLWQDLMTNASGVNFFEEDWGVGDLRLARSVDGGNTFESAMHPTVDEEPTERWYADLEVLGNGSTILIPYIDNNLISFENRTSYITDKFDYLTQLNILRSDDGGKAFHKITLDKTACQCCDIDTALGPDGEVYFAWRDSDKSMIGPIDPNYGYNYNYTKDDYDPNALDAGVTDEIIFSTARDIVVARTNDNGTGLSYTKPVLVQDERWLVNSCPVIGPSIEFDDNGRLHTFYFTGNGTEGTGYYYTYSDDRGQTFHQPIPILVSDFIPASKVQTDLSIDSDNNIWISYATTPDIIEHGEEATRTIHVNVIDQSGNVLGKHSFPSGMYHPATPDLISDGSTTWIAYPDGDKVRVTAMTLENN
jgi:hypothetical protein